jgi:hypothetical protein
MLQIDNAGGTDSSNGNGENEHDDRNCRSMAPAVAVGVAG